ncbi:hypothetical protein F5146DRAFT_1005722 [Armillaria mellea]|nr:hypothetical protein F5146DRAFT_1005722 [Armillaria mellea]
MTTSCPFAWQPSHRRKMVLFMHPAAPRTPDSNCSTPHTSIPYQSGKYAPPIPISTDSAYPVSTSREITIDHELPMPERPGILSEMPNWQPSGVHKPPPPSPPTLKLLFSHDGHKRISILMNTSHIQFLKHYAKVLAWQEHAMAGLDNEGDLLVETGALEDTAEQLVLDSCEVGVKRLVVISVEVDKVMLSDEEVTNGVVSVELVSSFSIEDIDTGLITVIVRRGFKVVNQHGGSPTVIDVGPSSLIEMGSMVYICAVTRAMGYRNRSLDIFMMVIMVNMVLGVVLDIVGLQAPWDDHRECRKSGHGTRPLSEDKTAIIGVPGVMFTGGNGYRYFGHVDLEKLVEHELEWGGKLTGMVE